MSYGGNYVNPGQFTTSPNLTPIQDYNHLFTGGSLSVVTPTSENEMLRTIVKAQQETISRLLALLEKAAKE